MKKLFAYILIIVLILCLVSASGKATASGSINDKLIRFHVIANSDSIEDQNVKLKIRDAILKDIGPKLAECKTREESITIIQKNIGRIEYISNSILKNEGKSYKAKAMVGNFEFPIKSYGSITLPAGEYEALRVVLGDGDGKNWWCVMFPPLCFIDITRGVTTKETDEELKKVLNDDEIQSITAFKQVTDKKEVVVHKAAEKDDKKDNNNENMSKTKDAFKPTVEFRFKSVELFNRLKDIIKNNL